MASGHEIISYLFFIVISTSVLWPAHIEAINQNVLSPGGIRKKEFEGPEQKILLADDTPIIEAYREKYQVQYRRSTVLITDIFDPSEGQHKKKRSINEDISFTDEQKVPEQYVNKWIEKRDVEEQDSEAGNDINIPVVYPTALVIMDYRDRGWSIKETVKYVVTFWNSARTRFAEKHKETIPAIRIAALVAVQNDAFGKIMGNDFKNLEKVYDKIQTYRRTSTVWKEFFPPESYDFVAYMKDTPTTMGSVHKGPKWFSKWKPLCGHDDERVGDIMIWDDGNFSGLERVVKQLSYIWPPLIDGLPEHDFVDCELNINTALNYAWCLTKPKKYFAEGGPLDLIFPSDYTSQTDFCAKADKWYSIYVDPERPCYLMCYRTKIYGYIDPVDFPYDGLQCGSTRDVCIDGKCIKKKWTQ